MSKLGVFITTNISERSKRPENNPTIDDFFSKFKLSCEQHDINNSGVDTEYFIMDTGSKHPEYLSWVQTFITKENWHFRQIPNIGCWLASMKYLMNTDQTLMDNFDLFLFQIDDVVYPTKPKWALNILSRFTEITKPLAYGLTMKLKTGHPNNDDILLYSQFNRDEVHIHGQYYFINHATLTGLKDIWYDSDNGRKKKAKILYDAENTDLDTISDQERLNLSKVYIGREWDIASKLAIVAKNRCIASNALNDGLYYEEIN